MAYAILISARDTEHYIGQRLEHVLLVPQVIRTNRFAYRVSNLEER